MYTFKSNEKHAHLAVLFAWIYLGTQVLCLVSSVLQLNQLQRVPEGVSTFDATTAANDLREGILGLLAAAGWITCLVLFLVWFYRARVNLQTRISHPLSCTSGWAVGYFFVPIVCLYRPYQVVRELYAETRGLLAKDGLNEHTALKTDYVGWWWTLWIISAFVDTIILRMMRRAETLEGLIRTTYAEMVSECLGIMLALLIIVVIRDYARVEPLLETMVGEEAEAEVTE